MSLPVPKDGESQPDFALRFHEAAMSAIPNTAERNQRCFEIFREHVGEEPEVAEARKYHKADDYIERRDIAVFEEHEIPARKTQSGRTIPAVKYGKRELAAICRNMNEQIADVGKFCPITNGHTSDNLADPKPEVLAYTGAYRLGMIGNKKPRYAIFTDEYHRKDREEVLRGMRGRSVEVLPLPDVSKRTFYPIAALGADEPRLNLPPARYFNRPDDDGVPIEVERYMMVLPGGNSTSLPSDKYGDQSGSPEQQLSEAAVKQICQAMFATAPFQWVIAKMEEDGASGSPNPMVHQPPEMADMPADAMQQPGDPAQQTQPGGMPPAANDMPQPGPQGMPPAKPPAAAMPPADKPKPFEGKETMPEETKEQYSKSAGLSAIEQRLDALERENASLKAKLLGSERYSKLNDLKVKGFEFNIERYMAKATTQTDEDFAAELQDIEKYARRSVTAVADFSEVAGIGHQSELAPSAHGIDELAEDEAKEVRKYAMANSLDYVTARDRYVSEKKARKSVAG